MLKPTSDQVFDAAILDPDFMRNWMGHLARLSNLHIAAYVDLAEVLHENFAFLSAEDKKRVANLVRTVTMANDFFQEMADSELTRVGLLPDGDELASELLGQIPRH